MMMNVMIMIKWFFLLIDANSGTQAYVQNIFYFCENKEHRPDITLFKHNLNQISPIKEILFEKQTNTLIFFICYILCFVFICTWLAWIDNQKENNSETSYPYNSHFIVLKNVHEITHLWVVLIFSIYNSLCKTC